MAGLPFELVCLLLYLNGVFMLFSSRSGRCDYLISKLAREGFIRRRVGTETRERADDFLQVYRKRRLCLIERGGRTRPNPTNPSDPPGSESDSTRIFKKVKLTRPDPNST
jgi:hypothetical protein